MSKGSLNVKAAFLHNLTDAGASVAVLAGGAMVFWLDWTSVDPLLTLGIAGYILWMSYGMLKRTASILMEGTPDDLDLGELLAATEDIEGVVNLHHLHVWELDEHHRALEAHVIVTGSRTMDDLEQLKTEIKRVLNSRFGIAHSTLEMESENSDCEDGVNVTPSH